MDKLAFILMDIKTTLKETLDLKILMIAMGTVTILMGLWGVVQGDVWAEYAWGEGNVLAHDAAYERMWALHIVPYGVLAIGTGLFVTGKALAKMALLCPSVLVIIFIGMGYFTTEYDYGGPSGLILLIPVMQLLLIVLLGISGYLHLNDDESPSEA